MKSQNPYKKYSSLTIKAKDGYVGIANDVIESLTVASLSATEYKVLLVIIRKTYGFNKKTDNIPHSQFVKSTGISARHVKRTIKALKKKWLIWYYPSLQLEYGSPINKYGFNKYYDTWKIKKKKRGVTCRPPRGDILTRNR